MCPTAFLSMWVSNTATTAMMVPIAQAVLGEIEDIKKLRRAKNEVDNAGVIIESEEQVEMNVLHEKLSVATSTDELQDEVRKEMAVRMWQ